MTAIAEIDYAKVAEVAQGYRSDMVAFQIGRAHV